MLTLPAIIALAALATPGPYPTTCAAALRSYGTVRDVPTPFVVVSLPADSDSTRGAGDALLAHAARLGATGYLVVQVPDSAAKVRQRTVAVYVPADSARAQRSCGRVLVSY